MTLISIKRFLDGFLGRYIIMEYIYQLINVIKHYCGFSKQQNYEDLFYQLLLDKNYDEALKLAQQNTFLDIDLLYKLKWRSGGVTVASINSILGNINDKLWTINECVQTVPISYEACRRLIEFGLREANLRLLYQLGHEVEESNSKKGITSDKHEGKLKFGLSISNSDKSDKRPLLADDMNDEELEGNIDFNCLNEKQIELCGFRQDLIRYEHSLFTYENILGNYRAAQQHFDHVFYDEFRHKCPLEACIDYARDGEAHGVEIMFNFYTQDLVPHLLPILSNLPETLSPHQYRNLLPTLRENDIVYEWRSATAQIRKEDSDWSSRSAKGKSGMQNLKKLKEDYETNFYKEHEYLVKYRNTKRLRANHLTDWYVQRAREMEQRTLLLTSAIQLLRLGQKATLKGLDKTHLDLDEFDRILHETLSDENIYLSFNEFNSKPLIERMVLMTGDRVNGSEDMFKYYVIPYVKRRQSELDDAGLTALFKDYFTRLALVREDIWEHLIMSVNYQSIFHDIHAFLATFNIG